MSGRAGLAHVFLPSIVALALSGPCSGHPGVHTVGLLRIDDDGRVEIRITHDALALALNEYPARLADQDYEAFISTPREDLATAMVGARDRFAALFELRAEGRPLPIELGVFPSVETIEAWARVKPRPNFPVKLDITVRSSIPNPARVVSLRFPEVMGDAIITIDRPGVEPIALPLGPGEATPEFAPFPAAAPPASNRSSPPFAPSEPTRAGIAARYLGFGFTHILPHGLDHVLFVLGLFFLSPKWRPLLWQVTAFTLAHSITLAAAMLGVLRLDPAIAEPLIAASIVFVAVENLATSRLHPWRPAVVFIFGLIHGTGFAGVLQELGLPRGQLVIGLVGFNVGVELGQLAVLGIAFLVLGRWRERAWYRRGIAMPASAAIGAIGLYWTIERVI